MHVTRILHITFGYLILCLLTMSNSYADSLVYTQLTSTQSQPAIHPANLASLETVDGIENIGSALNKITINKAGFYVVIAVAQAGAVKPNAPANGYLDIWLVRNGTSIPNSNSRQSLNPTYTSTLTTQNIIQLNAGDSLSVAFSASDPAFGLVAIPATNLEPTITSMAFTIYKLD